MARAVVVYIFGPRTSPTPALGRRERAALKSSLSLDWQQTWADADKKGSAGRFVDFLAG
jgi:hypothetical protein